MAETYVDVPGVGIVKFDGEWTEQEVLDQLKTDYGLDLTYEAPAEEPEAAPLAPSTRISPDDPDYISPDRALALMRDSNIPVEEGQEANALDAVQRGWLTAEQSILSVAADRGLVDNEFVYDRIADLERKRRALPISEGMEAFHQSEGWTGAFSALAEYPYQIIRDVSLEGFGTSVPSFAMGAAGAGAGAAVGSAFPGPGTAIGGLTGLAGGVGAGSAVVESGAGLIERMAAAGVDTTNPQELREAFGNDEFMAPLREDAYVKGATIGGVDALTAGVAGRLLTSTGAGFLKKAGAAAGEMGIQVAGGAGGEALGSVAIGEEIDPSAVVAEGLGELGGGAGEIVLGASIRQAGKLGTPKPAPDAIPQPKPDTVDIEPEVTDIIDDPEIVAPSDAPITKPIEKTLGDATKELTGVAEATLTPTSQEEELVSKGAPAALTKRIADVADASEPRIDIERGKIGRVRGTFPSTQHAQLFQYARLVDLYAKNLKDGKVAADHPYKGRIDDLSASLRKQFEFATQEDLYKASLLYRNQVLKSVRRFEKGAHVEVPQYTGKPIKAAPSKKTPEKKKKADPVEKSLKEEGIGTDDFVVKLTKEEMDFFASPDIASRLAELGIEMEESGRAFRVSYEDFTKNLPKLLDVMATEGVTLPGTVKNANLFARHLLNRAVRNTRETHPLTPGEIDRQRMFDHLDRVKPKETRLILEGDGTQYTKRYYDFVKSTMLADGMSDTEATEVALHSVFNNSIPRGVQSYLINSILVRDDPSHLLTLDTVGHEVWHALWTRLTPKEKKLLRDNYDNLRNIALDIYSKNMVRHYEREAARIRKDDPKHNKAHPVFEISALVAGSAFQEIVAPTQAVKARGWSVWDRLGPRLRPIFYRMWQFLQRTANFLKGQGFNTIEDVYTRYVTGEITRRPLPEEYVDNGINQARTLVNEREERFKTWFEDSMVRNSDGTPKMVYHGTFGDFRTFTRTQDIGFHFGTVEDANYVTDHASPGEKSFVIPAYLQMRSPLYMRDMGDWDPAEMVEELTYGMEPDFFRLGGYKGTPGAYKSEKIFQFNEGRDLLKRVEDAMASANSEAGRPLSVTEVRTLDDAQHFLRSQAYEPTTRDSAFPYFMGRGTTEPEIIAKYTNGQNVAFVANKPMSETKSVFIFKRVNDKQRNAYRILREALRNKGYDGIVYRNEGEGGSMPGTIAATDAYVVFSPRQIKTPFAGYDNRDKARAKRISASIQQGNQSLSVPRNIKKPDAYRDLNWLTTMLNTAKHIAHNHPKFAPIFWLERETNFTRTKVATDAALDPVSGEKLFAAISDLPQQSQRNVFAFAELLRLQELGLPPTNQRGLYEITNTGQATANTQQGDKITLTAEEGAAFEAMQKGFQSIMTAIRDSYLEAQGFDPGMTVEDLQKHLKDITDMAQRFLDAGQKANAEKAVRLGQKVAELAEEVSRLEAQASVPYIPFMRFGDWAVAVKNEKGRLVHFEAFEVGAKRSLGRIVNWKKPIEERRKALQKQYPNDTVTEMFPLTKDQIRNRGFQSLLHFDLMAGMLSEDTREQYADIRDEIMKEIAKRGFARHMTQARKIPGYSTDITRVLGNYAAMAGNYVAKQRFQNRMMKALGEINLGHERRLYDYASKYIEYSASPQEELTWLRNSMFAWHLGLNVSTAMLQTVTIPTVTVPYLSQFGSGTIAAANMSKNFTKAIAAVPVTATRQTKAAFGKAPRTLEPFTIMDPAKIPGLNKKTREAITRMWNEGVLKPTITLEAMGLDPRRLQQFHADLFGFDIGQGAQKILESTGVMFNTAEAVSRVSAAITAFEMASKPGFMDKANRIMTNDHLWQENIRNGRADPYHFAVHVVDETFGVYGKGNRAVYARGWRTALFQFMSYSQQIIELWARMSLGLHGKEGVKTAALMAGALFIFGGWQGLPLAEDLKDFSENILSGVFRTQVDIDLALREAVVDMGGSKEFAEALSRGAFRLLGVDISRRAALGTTPATEMIRSLVDDRMELSDVLGVSGSTIIGGVKDFFEKNRTQPTFKALMESLAPTPFRNLYQAYHWQTKGVRTGADMPLLKPEDLDKIDIMMKMYGFNPSKVAQAREYNRAANRQARLVQEKQSDFYTRLANAITARKEARDRGDVEEAAQRTKDLEQVKQEIRDWNAEARGPEEKILIDEDHLKKIIERRLTDVEVSNILRAPKKARKAVRDLRSYFIIPEDKNLAIERE